MTKAMTIQAARNPEAFLFEIGLANGFESMIYVWAKNVVNEIKNEMKKAGIK